MIYNDKNTVINYDGIAKKSLDSLKDENIIRFINSTFSKNFEVDATVVRMATETTTSDLKQKRCDYFISINDEMFLIEIQSYDDDEMAIRVFDYGYRGAVLHGKILDEDGVYEFKFPDPAVFYLRKGNVVHDKLSIRLKTNSGETLQYNACVIYLDDYSFSDMIEKYMFPMIPFYSMRYEKILFSKHTEQDEEKILEDLVECNKKLKNAYRENIISGEAYHFLREWLVNIFRSIVKKAKQRNTMVNEQEADRIMQMMIDEPIEGFDIFKALDDSRSEGKSEGKAEGIELGIIGILSSLVKDGTLTIEAAAARADMSVDEFRAKAKL